MSSPCRQHWGRTCQLPVADRRQNTSRGRFFLSIPRWDRFRSNKLSQYFLGHNCTFSYKSGNWLSKKALNALKVLNVKALWGHHRVLSIVACPHWWRSEPKPCCWSWSVLPLQGGVGRSMVVCRILSNIWTLNYISTSQPLTTELPLITEVYILLIFFETHGHWQSYFIITVSAKSFSCHPVHCKDTLSSVMVMKEILIMSGFKAITVSKLCLCPFWEEEENKS